MDGIKNKHANDSLIAVKRKQKCQYIKLTNWSIDKLALKPCNMN